MKCTSGMGTHEYSPRECPFCYTVFCYSCSGGTGGLDRYERPELIGVLSHYESWIKCPKCGGQVDL